MTDQQTMTGFMLNGALLLMLFGISFLLKGDARAFMLNENGLVESGSVLGYLLCLIMMACQGKIPYLKKYHYTAMLILFFMLRELDFHKRFTSMGMFKTKFYFTDATSFAEKIAGTIVIMVLCYILFMIISRHSKYFLSELKKRSAIGLGILFTLGFLTASVTLDGLGKNLSNIGITISQQLSLHAAALEEIAELGIPIAILLTLSAYFYKQKQDHNTCGNQNADVDKTPLK